MLKTIQSSGKILMLPDGRKLGYDELGDPNGIPVIVFHGTGISRQIWNIVPDCLLNPGIRLIAPDRPGYGQTDFLEDVTTLENWPSDIEVLADSLGIRRFAVFGASGGGPYALSCAWKIPERLTAIGIYASIGPSIPETEDRRMAVPVRFVWKWAPRLPHLFRLQVSIAARMARILPKAYIRLILNEFSDVDQDTFKRLNLAERIQASRQAGYQQGGAGTWYDIAIVPCHWPIPLDMIKSRVYLWQGESDITVPPAVGKYLAARLPDCKAKFIRNAGHFWIFEHFDEILGQLLEAAGQTN